MSVRRLTRVPGQGDDAMTPPDTQDPGAWEILRLWGSRGDQPVPMVLNKEYVDDPHYEHDLYEFRFQNLTFVARSYAAEPESVQFLRVEAYWQAYEITAEDVRSAAFREAVEYLRRIGKSRVRYLSRADEGYVDLLPPAEPQSVGELDSMPDLRKTIEELEDDPWDEAPSDASYLIRTCYQLRGKALLEFTVEDLRIMLAQGISVPLLLPLALARLEEDPFSGGDFYPGDLIAACTRHDLRESGAGHLLARLGAVVRNALEELPRRSEVPRDLGAHLERFLRVSAV